MGWGGEVFIIFRYILKRGGGWPIKKSYDGVGSKAVLISASYVICLSSLIDCVETSYWIILKNCPRPATSPRIGYFVTCIRIDLIGDVNWHHSSCGGGRFKIQRVNASGIKTEKYKGRFCQDWKISKGKCSGTWGKNHTFIEKRWLFLAAWKNSFSNEKNDRD